MGSRATAGATTGFAVVSDGREGSSTGCRRRRVAAAVGERTEVEGRKRWFATIELVRPSSSTSDLRIQLLLVERSTDPFEPLSGPDSSRGCSPERVGTSSDSDLLLSSCSTDASLPCSDCFSSTGEAEEPRGCPSGVAIEDLDSTAVDRTRSASLGRGREREEGDWKVDDEATSFGTKELLLDENPAELLVGG